jgi:lipopolysaccharide/colanic/teichoic acid biosynthesis glycosyltransferase
MRMQAEIEQGSNMGTERTDYQMRVVTDIESPTATIERITPPQTSAVPVNGNDIAEQVRDDAWFTLLTVAHAARPGRILYCFVFKRMLDLTIALASIILLAPLFALVAALIWLDAPGAVIFKQRRIGRYGKAFTLYKFRTMIPDRRTAPSEYTGPERRKTHKTARDPRVTRIGRFMRRTSLDELPQLFNVLRGDMSLVGPRPELPEITRSYAAWQHQRHLVLPGLTGWWQTHGRSGLLMHEHTELDIYYVEHISLSLDLRILAGTMRALVSRTGAF